MYKATANGNFPCGKKIVRKANAKNQWTPSVKNICNGNILFYVYLNLVTDDIFSNFL